MRRMLSTLRSEHTFLFYFCRIVRRELMELEERAAQQRDFLANSIAGLAASLSTLTDIIEVLNSK